MYNSDIRAYARHQLKDSIFSKNWLYAAVACFLVTAITAGLQYVIKKWYVPIVLVTGPLSYSLAYMFLQQSRDGEEMVLADLLKGFDEFVPSFVIGLLSHIFIALWSLLFVIPGIIKFYSYSMAYYIKVDNPEFSASQCLKASSQLMRGHKSDLFNLDLSFIGWVIVSALTGGIGFIWLIPYMHAAHANFYRSLISI